MTAHAWKLIDVLGLNHLQKLQDSFAGQNGLTMLLVDAEGERITSLSKGTGFCAALPPLLQADAHSREAVCALLEQCRRTRAPAMSTCPHTGLSTAAVPIFIDARLQGCWIIAQIRSTEPSAEQISAAAGFMGVSTDEARANLSSLPQIHCEQLQNIFAFLQTVLDTVLQLGSDYQKLKENRQELYNLVEKMKTDNVMLRHFVNSNDIAVYITDYHSGEVLMANNAFCAQVRLPMDKVIGRRCWELNNQNANGFCDYCPREHLLNGDNCPAGPHTWVYYNQKHEKWLRCTNQAMFWDGDRLAQMVTQLDVSQEHTMRLELERLAYYDRDTGLPNAERLLFDIDLALRRKSLHRHAYLSDDPASLMAAGDVLQYTPPGQDRIPVLSLIAVDISEMRHLVDIYGSNVGQDLQEAVHQWYLEQRFGRAILYKISGYKYCLSFYDESETHIKSCANKIINRFNYPWTISSDDRESSYLGSAHVSILHLSRDELFDEDIINLINCSLDFAREKKRLFIYDKESDRKLKDQLLLEQDIKNSIIDGMSGFAVFFQPIVDLVSGKWRGLEALCRWTSKQRGPVRPDIFIPEVEEQGLINPLGLWILEQAITTAKELALDDIDGFFLSVNLSPLQLMDDAFADNVTALLERYDYPGEKLNLEITESAQMTFSSFTVSAIEKLRSRGITIALDDFGTGYSSFNSLKNLPVNFLKTEREFVSGIENDNHMQYFFFFMAEIAHANFMKLIAEGVETAEQLELIKKNGADYIQGYFFAKPMCKDDLRTKLQAFHQVHEAIHALKSTPVNINQWLNSQKAYIVTPNLFKLLNQSIQLLMSSLDLDSAFEQVLEVVGKHFSTGRAFSFIKTNHHAFRHTHEWCAPGISPQRDSLAHYDIDEGLQALLHTFRRDGMIVTSDVTTLPVEIYDVIKAPDTVSIVVLPMWRDSKLVGVVGFDDNHRREWTPEEIIVLWNLCIIMADNVHREKLKVEVDEKKRMLTNVLNSSAFSIMISDMKTHDVLWINNSLREELKEDRDIHGLKCHELIHGRSMPCPHCKMSDLKNNPSLEHTTYEYYDERRGRTFMIYNAVTRWEKGRKANIEYFLDVTEHKRIERQLQNFSTLDPLTDTLNRATTMKTTLEMLKNAEEGGYDLTIALVDVARVKATNISFGLEVGDLLLCTVVEAIRSCIRKDDILGRLGGDEFLVVFPKCTKEHAEESLSRALLQLSRESLLPRAETISFVYGVAENTELPFVDADTLLNKILDLADERLGERKNQLAMPALSADGAGFLSSIE